MNEGGTSAYICPIGRSGVSKYGIVGTTDLMNRHTTVTQKLGSNRLTRGSTGPIGPIGLVSPPLSHRLCIVGFGDGPIASMLTVAFAKLICSPLS
jgi:hypothetical protein